MGLSLYQQKVDREVKGHAVITSPALPRINPEVAGEKSSTVWTQKSLKPDMKA